jgi:hypothetical protein
LDFPALKGVVIKKILSIIIPAFNEGKTIHLILDKIKAVRLSAGFGKEVIFGFEPEITVKLPE